MRILQSQALPQQLLLAAALLLSSVTRSSGYVVTSPSAVPVRRQVKWLKEMTGELCEAKPGELSRNQLDQAPELMHAWCNVYNVDKKECALAVESLVKRVIDERHAGNDSADLTVQDYNCLLEGWARSNQGAAAAERCEQILHAMQENNSNDSPLLPDLQSFKCVLMAWRQAASGGAEYAPARAQRILEWMIRLYTDGHNTQALPHADCFDIVMQIWSRSGHSRAPEQTERLMVAMERLYKSVSPPESAQQLAPRHTTFNAVLAAWCKSGRPEALDRALSILAFMEGQPGVTPDPASYNTIMGALARHPNRAVAAKHADAVVKRAVAACQQQAKNDNDGLALEPVLFNTAMGAWAKSNRRGAYRKARALLDAQRGLYYDHNCHSCRPDVVSYTSVMAACAAETGSRAARARAFRTAMETYDELPDTARPNQVSYGTMLKATARLLPAGSTVRRKVARKIFRETVAAGCVGDMVTSRLREAVPELYKELMEGHSKRQLPAEWTANVEAGDRHRRKGGKSKKSRRVAEV